MAKRKSRYPSNKEVRTWADERYFDVPKQGPLPKWVIEEWDKHHRTRKYVAEQAHHGTLGGYTYHKCREACCTEVWNAYMAEYAEVEKRGAA